MRIAMAICALLITVSFFSQKISGVTTDGDNKLVSYGSISPRKEKIRTISYNFHTIPYSRFKEVTLKLNIHSVKNRLVYKSLLNENVIFKTTATIGWQTIDLQKYKLTYTNLNKLAITLQMVENIPQDNINYIFGISAKKTLSNNLLYHYQS